MRRAALNVGLEDVSGPKKYKPGVRVLFDFALFRAPLAAYRCRSVVIIDLPPNDVDVLKSRIDGGGQIGGVLLDTSFSANKCYVIRITIKCIGRNSSS